MLLVLILIYQISRAASQNTTTFKWQSPWIWSELVMFNMGGKIMGTSLSWWILSPPLPHEKLLFCPLKQLFFSESTLHTKWSYERMVEFATENWGCLKLRSKQFLNLCMQKHVYKNRCLDGINNHKRWQSNYMKLVNSCSIHFWALCRDQEKERAHIILRKMEK